MHKNTTDDHRVRPIVPTSSTIEWLL